MKFLKSPFLFVFLLFIFTSEAQQNKKAIAQMDPEKSIISNAQASGNHNLLLAAVKVSELESTLDNDGPFTVFAPRDVNFDSTTKERVTELVRIKNKKELQSVIGYHIVAGKLTASKILKALCRGKGIAAFTTISGDVLTATMKGLDIILTDKNGNQSIITKADANQCNGVFHVIDSVNKPSKV
tara:strand:- start:16106 stop:16657 length:552 start_codon:yes stop_codon:yes gene_type:complete